MQEAQALVNASQAKIQAIQFQQANLKSSVQLMWGEALAQLITGGQTAPELNRLLTRQMYWCK